MCRTITQFLAYFTVLAAIRVLAAFWISIDLQKGPSFVVFRFSPVERFGLLVLLVSAALGFVKETAIRYNTIRV